MHSHLAGEEEKGQGYASLVMRSGAQDAIVGVRNARLVLEAGFTTVRDVGSFRAFTDVAIREGIEEGWFPGPRMLCAGVYVTCPGGGGDITGLAVDIDTVVPSELRFGVTSGVDQMRANVRRIIGRGADFIKIIATGAVLTAGTNPGAPEFTEDELRAAVEETALLGTFVAAHAHGPVGIARAVRAGVRYTLLKDLDEVLHEDLREIELHFQERPSLNWAELTEELNRKAEGHDFHHWFVQFYGPDGEPTWSSINTPELPAFTDEQRRQKAFSVMDYRASYQVLKQPAARAHAVCVGCSERPLARDIATIDRLVFAVGLQEQHVLEFDVREPLEARAGRRRHFRKRGVREIRRDETRQKVRRQARAEKRGSESCTRSPQAA
jgi:hypothetical protein